MRKRDERERPDSCWNKARDDERLFVLLDRDEAFPGTVRFWAAERVRLGLNRPGDPKLESALREADEVERDHASRG
ncbi:MAG TPA: hypothetical protein VJ739_03230 [Gemmataceae bacterium]|nr:hypothetical protein [Gemmataceae bacterium]